VHILQRPSPSSLHSFNRFPAQQTYFTMATLGFYPQTTIHTGQHFPMATLGYHPQPIINAVDDIAALKQQFRNAIQQPKQKQIQRPASHPRRNSNPTPRDNLSENHLAIGTIVFLPQKNPIRKYCTCVLPDCQRRQLHDRGYGHPAVVLAIRDDRPNGELTALCCIVRHPQLLKFSTGANPRQISANPQPNAQEPASKFTLTHVPTGSAEAPTTAPNGATILYLEQESTMYKKSHVNDSHVYAIPISQLTNLGTPLQNRLTKESYKALIGNFPSLRT
jgi:hypothetical protein